MKQPSWIDKNAELFLNLMGLAIIIIVTAAFFLLTSCSSIEVSDEEILASLVEACETQPLICNGENQ